jgi:hypothetical protein
MAKIERVYGFSGKQVDAITLKISHVEALAEIALDGTEDGKYISLFTVMQERLSEIKDLVSASEKIGGRP